MGNGKLQAALTFLVPGNSTVGAERIALLEAIDRLGSLSAAARHAGLSYRAAWDAMRTMNSMLAQPVAIPHAGGKHGGDTIVTPLGHRVITAFHQLQSELARFTALLREGGEAAEGSATSLPEGIFMRTSARNMLRAVVCTITPGAVNTLVTLSLPDQLTLDAMVTNRSVENLGLSVGRNVMALIKSNFVALAAANSSQEVPARNQIKGVVAHLDNGAVNTEVSVAIGRGKSLTSIVKHQRTRELGLDIGTPVVCSIKSSHIILAVE